MIAYDTITEALSDLKSRGFNLDFNLQENCLICQENRYSPADFDIVEVYRFEGDSDPADEAVVYAIESVTGQKGVMVNGYGITADEMSSEMAKKLQIHRK